MPNHYGRVCCGRGLERESAFPQVGVFIANVEKHADENLRTREDELLYVLRKLHALRLWRGSLWAALSTDPTAYCITQPGRYSTRLLLVSWILIDVVDIDTSSSPSQLIADAVKRSAIAHLFHFYPVLCEIASIPRKTPSTWVITNTAQGSPLRTEFSRDSVVTNGGEGSVDQAVQLDARVLARECLKEVGKEMGVSK